MGILDDYRHSGVTMTDSKSKLKHTIQKWYQNQKPCHAKPRTEATPSEAIREILSQEPQSSKVVLTDSAPSSVQEMALFASHDSYGVVDLGATKTV